MPQTGLVTGYGTTAGRFWITLSTTRSPTQLFHFFGPLRKHLAGKRYAIDADVKQAVTSWLDTLTLVSSTNA